MFSIKTILYPTDFSPRAEHAFHIAFARSFWTWMELSLNSEPRAWGAEQAACGKGSTVAPGVDKRTMETLTGEETCNE